MIAFDHNVQLFAHGAVEHTTTVLRRYEMLA